MSQNQPDLFQLKSNIAQSFSVLIVREFFLKIIAFGAQVVLARILLPKDFGFYAIIAFIVSIFGLFSDIGLSSAIIQKQTAPTKKELSTIFFVQCGLSIILIILIVFLSRLVHIIYPYFSSDNIVMLQIFSLSLFFTALSSVPTALLERDLQYGVISKVDIIGVVIYYVVAIVCAAIHFGIWSFIAAILVKEAVETALLFYHRKWFPSLMFEGKSIHEMVRFGVFIQGGGIVTFLNTAVTPVIAGIKSGPTAVGLLDWGTNVVAVPESVTNNFGRIAFAGFSKIQSNRELLSKAIEKSIKMLNLIVLLFAVLIFAFAYQGVTILYTQKWFAGIPALYWFSASAPTFAIMAAFGQGILVLKNSKAIFIATLISNIFGWILAYVLVLRFDYTGIAAAGFFTSILLLFLYIFIGKKSGISINIFKTILPQFAVAVMTFAFAYVLNYFIQTGFILLSIKVSLTIACYILLAYIFAKEEIVYMLNLAKTMLRKINI